MKIRTECPKNNKYYIRKVTGGLNGAVAGYPTQRYANVLDNCVGFANGRYNESINDPDLKGVVKAFKYQLVCDAEDFIESAKRQGLKISSTPIEGGVMVWQKGRTLSPSDGAGHVAFVERVYDDGSILTSESGWGSWAFKTVRRDNKNGRWGQNANYKFRGCIINPSITNPKVVPVPPLVTDGVGGTCTVRAMQRFFSTTQDGVISGQNKTLEKYYPSLKAVEYGKGGSACIKKLQKWVGTTQDGVLGEKTVKAWQKKIGVSSDGIFGTNSMKEWQKYLNENEKAVYPIESETPQDKICVVAKDIADSGKYKYIKYDKSYAKQCGFCAPIKGKGSGGNCIDFAFHCWHVVLGSKCSFQVMTDQLYEKMLNVSAKEALKIVQDRIKLKDIKVITDKGGISTSKLKKGDIVAYFNGNNYIHTALYIGDGLIADCTSGRKQSVKYGVKSYSKWKIKIAIRYTGK